MAGSPTFRVRRHFLLARAKDIAHRIIARSRHFVREDLFAQHFRDLFGLLAELRVFLADPLGFDDGAPPVPPVLVHLHLTFLVRNGAHEGNAYGRE